MVVRGGVVATGVEEIGMFYLGESFLYRNLPDAIAYARELGYPYIFLTTNGRLATPDRVAACMRCAAATVPTAQRQPGRG